MFPTVGLPCRFVDHLDHSAFDQSATARIASRQTLLLTDGVVNREELLVGNEAVSGNGTHIPESGQ